MTSHSAGRGAGTELDLACLTLSPEPGVFYCLFFELVLSHRGCSVPPPPGAEVNCIKTLVVEQFRLKEKASGVRTVSWCQASDDLLSTGCRWGTQTEGDQTCRAKHPLNKLKLAELSSAGPTSEASTEQAEAG